MPQQRRAPVGLLLIIPVVIGLGLYAFTGQEPVVDPSATPEATATSTAAATMTAEAPASPTAYIAEVPQDLYPSPTPDPAIATERGPFKAGAWVRVRTGDGDCLNARTMPSMTYEYAAISVCLPEGFEGMLEGSAQQADGHWWWSIAGAGYVAEDYLEFVRMTDLRAPNAPALSGQSGLIAFKRSTEGGIWVMRPDGSDQRQLVAAVTRDGYNVDPQMLSWSPDGTQLAYNVPIYGDNGETSNELHVVSLDGADRIVGQGLAGRSWSPDGRRIGIVADARYEGMGSSYAGAPGWVDVLSGEVRIFGGTAGWDNVWHDELPSFNHDGTRLLISYYQYDHATSTETRPIIIADLDGNELARIAAPEGTTYGDGQWSPVADQIAFRASNADGDVYRRAVVIYDVVQARVVSEAPVPEPRPNLPGKCGGGDEMYRLAWSRDGARIQFSHMDGLTGTNGVWSHNLATGETGLVQASYAYSLSAGPGTLVVYGSGYIFVTDTTGGYPTLITDGHSPVWSAGQ